MREVTDRGFPGDTVAVTCVQMNYIVCREPGHVTSVRKAHETVGREMASKSQLNVQKVWAVWLGLHLF